MIQRMKRLWRSLGPGLITGAADNDPSGITTYSIAGARFGPAALWILLYVLPFMITIQSMCARIGATSGHGLAGNLKRHYPLWVLILSLTALLCANIFNIGADIYGMAGALNLVIPINIQVLAVTLSAFITLLVIVLRYHQIVFIFKWFALSLFVYGIALILVQPDWVSIFFHALIPTILIDREFFITIFAILGTTISPYLFFWQASEEAEDVKERCLHTKICKLRTVKTGELKKIEAETRIGMTVSNLVSFFIVSLAASTLFRAGAQDLTSLREAAEALRPVAGPYAFGLFAIGILGSGLLAIPVLAGSAAYAVAELMGWPASLDRPFNRARAFYMVMVTAVALGMLLPFVGITPVQALFWAAIFNGLISPLLIMIIIHMASNPAVVGTHVSSRQVHGLGIASLFVVLTGSLFVLIS